MDHFTTVVIIGFLLRLLPGVIPSISGSLASFVELTNPITSFATLKEALFYLDNGIDAYNGGNNHHPPLLVTFFMLFHGKIPDVAFNIVVNLVFAIADLVICHRLVVLNRWYNHHCSQRLGYKVVGLNDSLIASFYLFNPLMLLSSWCHSTVMLSLLFITESIHQLAVYKNLPRSMISLSIATYLSFTPIYLVVPILAFAHSLLRGHHEPLLPFIYFQGPALFISSCGLLIFFSLVITSSFLFFDQCYGTIIRFDNIKPNLGLWWYFFTEMFDFFTPFYIGTFNIFQALFIAPMTIRFFEYQSSRKFAGGDSFLAIILCYLWISFTKSYPTVADLGYALSFLPIFAGSILPYCKLVYASGLALIISLVLSPIFHYCWIVLGNGNSNFFYSINLIWGGVHVGIMIDFIWGKLVLDYCEANNVPKKERPSIRLTQV